MYVLTFIFIILALITGVFSTALVGREVALEEMERHRKKKLAQEAASEEPAPAPVLTEEPTPAPVVEEASATVEPTEETAPAMPEALPEEGASEDKVAFSRGSQSIDEKYMELSPEYRGYYDEIVRCAMAVEGSKRFKNAAYEEYKVGKSRLVRLKIRRGEVLCELVIQNLAFKNYVSDNKVAVRQAPATIRVSDEAALAAVKDSVGIAVQALEEERAYKKEQAKLRRRQNRAAAREAALAARGAGGEEA